MKISIRNLAFVLITFLAFTACNEENIIEKDLAGKGVATQAVIDLGLPGGSDPVDADGNVTVSRNLTLTSGNTYILHNFFRIQSGYTITIQAGVTIKGADQGATTDDIVPGTLVIERGADINAVGTSASPIVFTSDKTTPAPGDWGGVIILGDAPVCAGEDLAVEGLPTPNNTGLYGGSSLADDSGTMKYVVIEYGGNEIGLANEINGLTLAGVGSGTELDYIQVRYNLDDGFEWFGGTVSAKHLVAVFNGDDDFDTDFGWSGTVQYGVAIRVPDANHLSTSDTGNSLNGNETNGDSDDCASDFTTAQLSNITYVGPYQNDYSSLSNGYINAAYTSRNSAGVNVRDLSRQDHFNSVMLGMYIGVRVSNDASLANQFNSATSILTDRVDIKNSVLIVPSNGDPEDNAVATRDDNTGSNWNSTFTTSGLNNVIRQALSNSGALSMAGRAGLSNDAWDAIDNTMPDLVPLSGSILLNTGVTPPSAFDQVDYRGAFGSSNWMANWTNWN